MQLFLEYDSSRVKSSKCVKSKIIARRVALLLVVFVTSNDIAQADVNGIPYNSNFPKAQYPYAQAPDGCSGWSSPTQVRDTWGPVSFREACNQHDRCYYTAGSSWNTCNERFYSDLRSACERDLRIPVRVPDPTLNDPLRTRKTYLPPEPASLSTCYTIATSYYTAVQAGVAFGIFKEAQSLQRGYNQWTASLKRSQDIIQIYREILGRDVDPSGMDTWTRELESGRSVLQVRRAIAESPEAQNKLNDLYRRMLGRDIDPSGRATWTNALTNGWSIQKVANEGIAPSSEYRRQDVIRIYREILERDVDPSGMDTWTRELESGRSVLQVRRAIAESSEAQNKLNELYRRMLCRDIDPSGRATWTNALANGWSLHKVANEGIAPSPEYQSRAGRTCN
jgi:hypothetical protein